MKNKLAIQSEFEKIKKLDASTVLSNLAQLEGHNKFRDRNDFLHHIESNIFDKEDREIYNELLDRKPISYDFQPSILARSWAILAILSVIRP